MNENTLLSISIGTFIFVLTTYGKIVFNYAVLVTKVNQLQKDLDIAFQKIREKN